MTDLPPPPVPADCDLTDFPGMMLDVRRLFASSFNAAASTNPLAWMCGTKLWMRSWHQVPAASLPDDDAQLCHLAELGFDLKSWRKVRALALRNWVKCSDGLLYHPVEAEKALDAWNRKLEQRWRTEVARIKAAETTLRNYFDLVFAERRAILCLREAEQSLAPKARRALTAQVR